VKKDLGDTPPQIFREQLHRLADWIADFRGKIETLRVAPDSKPGAIRAALPAQPPEQGEAFEKILADVDRVILPGMVHWSHPMFLAYFGWTATAPGILSEMISAPKNFDGVVYDTASVGIMHALAVAREEAAPSTRKLGLTGRNLPRFRIYTSDQAHSSAEKAAIALGLGEESVCRVSSDKEFRMDTSILRESVMHDRESGFKPLAVVATVGTTSTASVDPVAEIAGLCREEKIWLHVDGAYGGGFAIVPEYEWIAEGWSEADSIIINPHKTLFVPLDFSVLYVRDIERLRRVFSLVPEYLQGDTLETERNYMDYGIQLGRRFRALKAWMIWRSFGREGVLGLMREHLRLARLFGKWVSASNDFELSAPISMGVVCFRAKDKIDAFNSRIVESVNRSGRAYLNQTKLRGQTVIRLGLGNILTKEKHLRDAWELIQETARLVSASLA